MRTTIDFPADVLQAVKAVAQDRNESVSSAVVDLVKQALTPAGNSEITVSPITGLPVLHVGRTVTSEDVRALEDEEDAYVESFIRRPSDES